jgi:uncharacterized membrane protein
MNSETSSATVRVAGHPLLNFLVSFPIACFTGALATDIAYWQTAQMLWADFSAWLLAVGIFMGVLAGIAAVVDALLHWRTRTERPAHTLVIGSLLVLILAFFNNLVHSRDAWTSVVPEGLALSAVTVVVMLLTLWFGAGTVYRRGVLMQYSGARP